MSDLQNAPQKKVNPLASYFRQPKIYIRLPSGGEFYPPGSLDISATGEYPVFAMTAKDELMFKTPDALLSGQSTVEVIKSCIPAILDPWKMPTVDIDAVLIAIRVATYGEVMEVETNCPNCNAENSYGVNLVNWLGGLADFKYESQIFVDPLVVHIRPYTYQELTKTSLKTLEQQRVFDVINDEKMSDEEKISRFNDSFVKITSMTVNIIATCISKIESPAGVVTDQEMILDFINNAPKDVFDKISVHLQDLKGKIELTPQDAKCAECDTEFVMPVTMDQSNFFAVRS